jgi:2-dehydro-3-deoxyphosphogluconate aldolase/(4S)-4-hydroxy-2-oxoglutarate aldolase
MITPAQSSETILSLIANTKVIPVLTVDNVNSATELAKVLVSAGLPILEVTLRTPAALQAIEKMANVDGAIIAAGTVLNTQHVTDCKSAGAKCLVSPGYTASLIKAATNADMPLLPGAATAAEMMFLLEQGFSFLKFFPAEVNGGIAALKAFSSPLSQISFCPTGGVSAENLLAYLALSNVICVGGSWLVTTEDLKNKNWRNVEKKAKLIVGY